jgi:hypothetical protein
MEVLMKKSEFTGNADELADNWVIKNEVEKNERVLLLKITGDKKKKEKDFFRKIVVTGINEADLKRIVLEKTLINIKVSVNTSDCGNFYFAKGMDICSRQGRILKIIKRIPPEAKLKRHNPYFTPGF